MSVGIIAHPPAVVTQFPPVRASQSSETPVKPFKSGRLFFDDDPKRTPAERIQRAADYFRRKGFTIDSVVCNHADMPAEPVAGLTVVSSDSISRANYWCGVSA